jgi:hypothetical protein
MDHRYHVPIKQFEYIGDVEMHLSNTPVTPTNVDAYYLPSVRSKNATTSRFISV